MSNKNSGQNGWNNNSPTGQKSGESGSGWVSNEKRSRDSGSAGQASGWLSNEPLPQNGGNSPSGWMSNKNSGQNGWNNGQKSGESGWVSNEKRSRDSGSAGQVSGWASNEKRSRDGWASNEPSGQSKDGNSPSSENSGWAADQLSTTTTCRFWEIIDKPAQKCVFQTSWIFVLLLLIGCVCGRKYVAQWLSWWSKHQRITRVELARAQVVGEEEQRLLEGEELL